MKIKYLGKCIFIEKENILVVGDLHLGFEENLNKSGIFIGRKMLSETINYFEVVFDKIKREKKRVSKVVLLGDVKHGFARPIRQEWGDVLSLLDYFLDKKKVREVVIIKGNHDNYIMNIAGKRKVRVLDYYIWKGICFLHGDRDFLKIHDKKIKIWIMGHGHPAIKISDGIKEEKFKCILEGKYEDKRIIILPSFVDFSQGSDIKEQKIDFIWKFNIRNFKVRVIGKELETFEFGKLKKIK